ncbi:hypothetical protein AVEN_58328-2-1, partial [Araneus ventricosus]
LTTKESASYNLTDYDWLDPVLAG